MCCHCSDAMCFSTKRKSVLKKRSIAKTFFKAQPAKLLSLSLILPIPGSLGRRIIPLEFPTATGRQELGIDRTLPLEQARGSELLSLQIGSLESESLSRETPTNIGKPYTFAQKFKGSILLISQQKTTSIKKLSTRKQICNSTATRDI